MSEKLVPLLSRSFPNVEVRSEDRRLDAERDDFDLHLPMGSLYKHFIDEITEKGKVNSYLIPDPEKELSLERAPEFSWEGSICRFMLEEFC